MNGINLDTISLCPFCGHPPATWANSCCGESRDNFEVHNIVRNGKSFDFYNPETGEVLDDCSEESRVYDRV